MHHRLLVAASTQDSNRHENIDSSSVAKVSHGLAPGERVSGPPDIWLLRQCAFARVVVGECVVPKELLVPLYMLVHRDYGQVMFLFILARSDSSSRISSSMLVDRDYGQVVHYLISSTPR